MELASIAEVPPILCKDKQRSFACQGQKSVLRALLCPQEGKRKAPLLQKLQQGGGGAGRIPPMQRHPAYLSELPIECDCKGTNIPRYHQRCALFN